MQVHVFDNNEILCDELADWIVNKIKSVLEKQTRFTFSLSGGSTPKILYKKLCERKDIEWDKIHFFWGDERTVPFEDERNNAGMAFHELLNKIPVSKDQIHVMRTDIPLHESLKEYDRILHNYFPSGKTFDLVLLGMGNDGHTLSLFPGSDLLNDNHSWVASAVKPGEDISRITLMPAVVNLSQSIVFLVSGKEKAPMIKNVLELDPYYPANLIAPASNDLHWFLDADASSLLV